MSEKRMRLLFSEGHFVAIVSGQKMLTLRMFREEAHRFKKHQIIYGEFPEGIALMLQVTADTELHEARHLSNEIAREDGYTSAFDAWEGLKLYYGNRLVDDSTIACIRFKIAEIYSEPVIKLIHRN